MKQLRKKQLNINGVIFNVYSKEIEQIEAYFKDFIVDCNDIPLATYEIYYENDKKLFEEILSKFNFNNSKKLNTFKNQNHYQNENKFLIENQDYLCIKNDEYHYKIFGNGTKDNTKGLSWIIRELLIRELESRNYYYMHGTGIVIENKGVLILGNSGSGKTTLATKLIEQKEGFMLSNDRVFINSNQMFYYPLSINYPEKLIEESNELREYYIKNNKNGKVPLTAINLIYPNIKNITKHQIDLLIFPKIIENGYEITKLSENDVLERLEKVNFTPIDTENERKEWLKYRSINIEELEQRKKETHKKLVQKIPAIEVAFDVKNKMGKVLTKIL